MIDILILDDQPEKISSLKNFLMNECDIDEQFIETGSSIKEGRRRLYEKSFDLLLLDLVLPIDEESDANANNSIEFLNQIYINNRIKIPIHIIGFSQFEDAIATESTQFEDKLWHLIKFDYQNTDWKNKLKSKINHLISTKQSFKESIQRENSFDIGILCALERPELSAILDYPLLWEEFKVDNLPIIFHKASISTINGFDYKIVACSINSMGMPAAATVATMMICKFKLKYLFMPGICAGVKNKIGGYGDILIGERTLDYGFGKLKEDDKHNQIFEPDPQQIPADRELLAKVQDFLRDEQILIPIYSNYKNSKPANLLSAYVGPIASGSYVVSSASFVSSIIEKNRKLLGIDMEGYGGYLACQFSDSKALFLKSVCDFGDSTKNDDYQNYAAYTSSQFLFSFIRNQF